MKDEIFFFPINCCCDASKTLGFVPVHSSWTKEGQIFAHDKFKFPLKTGGVLELEMDEVSSSYVSFPAVKNTDLPLETLEQIEGFEPFPVPYPGKEDKAALLQYMDKRDEILREKMGSTFHEYHSKARLLSRLIDLLLATAPAKGTPL